MYTFEQYIVRPFNRGESEMPVPAIPDGYHTVTPYLIIKGAVKALDFYKRAPTKCPR